MRPLSHQSKDTGFTLIELLVVVVIIGILAGIALPVFFRQRDKAYDAGIQSDLRNYATAAHSAAADTGALPATVAQWTATLQPNEGRAFKAYIATSGGKPGFVLVGADSRSTRTWALSSWGSSAPIEVTSDPAKWTAGKVTTWTAAAAVIGDEWGNTGITFDNVNGVRWGATHSPGP